MEVIGNFDFKGKGKLLRPVLADGEFPLDPSVGEVLFKDKKIFICVEIETNTPFWVQLTPELNTYRHDQTVAAMGWTVQHNLNTNIGNVQVYDALGKQIMPDEIDCSMLNTAVIKFAAPTAGVALMLVGDTVTGQVRANVAHVESFSESLVWVVVHNLGYHPNITCISDSFVVQPASIVHDSTMQATITFSSLRSGSVRCV